MTRTPSPASSAAVADRRRFIRLLGGGSVAAATLATLPGCASGLPDEALQPWADAAAQTDLRRHMLAHGLLAPNPHNRQPWIADLREPGRIHLVCDGERLLPETDPQGRQILIGCGAFLELAVIAAAERGVAVTVELFPGGEPDGQRLPGGARVATLTLGPAGSAQPDPLMAQIARRRTAKTAYVAGQALPPVLVERWQATGRAAGLRVGLVEAPAAMDTLRRITREAYEIECLTPRTWLESARLMRIGPDAIRQHRDGISLNAPMVRALHAVGLFDPMTVPQRGSRDFERVMSRWAPFETGSGYLWLASDGSDRRSQVRAGRAYVRLQLQATEAGIDMHPLSQALQEFPEMRGPYEALHRALGLVPGQQVAQMLARVGVAAEPVAHSPRRELASLLRA